MFSELLADAEILTGGEIPVTTAAIKAAANRIRQQGASTSASVSATDTVTVTDTDDIEDHIQLLQQQHQQQQQQISQYLQEIQDLREQLGLLQLQMIPDVITGNTIYILYI
jgi:predicted RNase H-like nuclease (RuvC/YqgF family)